MFEKILHELGTIKTQFSALIEELRVQREPAETVFLSTGLQATVNALKHFGSPVTAAQVAAVTGRARAHESDRLNELWRMGIVEKVKQGRRKVFALKKEV